MDFAEVMSQALFFITSPFHAFSNPVVLLKLTEVLGQAVLYTVVFFLFNNLFNKFVFKKQDDAMPSGSKIALVFMMFLISNVFAQWMGWQHLKENSSQPVVAIQPVTTISGQTFFAPEVESVKKPLKVDVQFASNSECEPVLTRVATNVAQYEFSSRGAVLESLAFFWQDDKQLVTMLPQGSQCFLVGLSGETPLMYEFVKSYELEQPRAIAVEYRAFIENGVLNKTFILYKDTYQVDLKVSINFNEGYELNDQQIRVFLPMPVRTEDLYGIVNTPSAGDIVGLQDIAMEKSATFKQYWSAPKLFGFTQRFLAQVCFASSPNALLRAYYAKNGKGDYRAILESGAMSLNSEFSWSFYMGPKTAKSMIAVTPYLGKMVQYGFLSPIAKPIFKLLVYIKERVGNYGWAIIILALLIKLILLPFTLKGEKSMRQQAEFEKKRAYLQVKFKNDKEALDQANADLVQKHGMPMLSGCLPMLLNIPIFIALNKILTSSIELHGASFLWLPDLSAVDPYYILGVMMCIGMILTPNANNGPRQMASKIGFALLLGAFTTYLSSGLAIFIVLNTYFGIVQAYSVRKIGWLADKFA